MKIKYNVEKLTVLLNDLHNVLHTPVSIFDKDFNFLAGNFGCGMTDYCRMVRDTGSLIRACFACDKDACRRCRDTGEGFSYVCHAGVWETITPVVVDKVVIGYIIFGQYKMREDKFNPAFFAKQNGIDKRRLKRYYESLVEMEKEQIESVRNILNACIEGFYLKDAVSLEKSEQFEKIIEYIDLNVGGDVRVETLCKKFLVNRMQMYAMFSENLSTTVKKYVLDKRIEKAKDLLETSKLSVTEIACAVGFEDYNNFIQRFKSCVGQTPLAYRKANKE